MYVVKTQFTVIKAPILSCAVMMMIIMIKYMCTKIANTARDSCMFGVVYSNIQKFTIIMIMKPIIFISIWIKYLNISIYLDNRTALSIT